MSRSSKKNKSVSIKVNAEDYATLVKIKGMLEVQSGEICTIPEAFRSVLEEYPAYKFSWEKIDKDEESKKLA